MKNSLWTSILITIFLVGCGGGGGNPGTCSGSTIYCAESAAGAGGAPTPGATGGSTSTDLFTKSGSGDAVFDIPARVTRIRVQGTFNGATSNFIVKVAGSNIVNVIIGTSRDPVALDGTYALVGGGTVEITSSSGVLWTFTEVQ